MYERFTDRARRILTIAQDESRSMGHSAIGTEHLLLALIVEGEGIGGSVLSNLGFAATSTRERVLELAPRGDSGPNIQIAFTTRGKKILELALREGLQLGHNYIGTEHILLGLIREGEGIAATVLNEGATLSVIRERVMDMLRGPVAPALTEVMKLDHQISILRSPAFNGFNPEAVADTIEALRDALRWALSVDALASPHTEWVAQVRKKFGL